MASLLAGLAGTALLAQTATEEPAVEAPAAGTATPEATEAGDTGAAALGRRGDRPSRGVPGLAPLELYDTDEDGTITQSEIETCRAECFAAADANGDGALSSEELIALEEAIREEMRQARATARAAAAITRMDDNGDGLLQAEELEARTPPLAPIFDELDADNDGGISQAELEAGRPARGGPQGGFGRGRHGGPGGGWGPFGG